MFIVLILGVFSALRKEITNYSIISSGLFVFCVSRRAHERPPPHPHRMHPNYGHGHHIHVPQTMSSHPRQAPERSAWSVSCLISKQCFTACGKTIGRDAL